MAARRQHLLDFAILGLLHEAPMHGYELRKRLNQALGPFRALSFGTLYPALRELLDGGLITESGPSAPATTRRPRIVYALTSRGRARFSELAARADETSYEDDGFELRVAFFARTESSVRVRILEGRLATLQDRLREIRGSAHAQGVGDIWTRAVSRHNEESLERDVRWLAELLAAERGSLTRPGTLTDPTHPAFRPPGRTVS